MESELQTKTSSLESLRADNVSLAATNQSQKVQIDQLESKTSSMKMVVAAIANQMSEMHHLFEAGMYFVVKLCDI